MTDTTPILYLAWQDADTRRWFPVGRLRKLADQRYEFVYLRGYSEAHAQAGMSPILGFPSPEARYVSDALFPHFQNRVMPRSREDYPVYLERLGLHEQPRDPLEILARSGGWKVTDAFSYYLFPEPAATLSPDGERRYVVCFFIHGMRYAQPAAQERARRAKLGEELFLMNDFQNPADPGAIAIRTHENHLLGYVPRFYCADLHELRRRGQAIALTVEHVNATATTSWAGVMCRIEVSWPEGFRPLSAPEYEPLAAAVIS